MGVSRLRKRIVFERLLARLVSQAPGEWVLKGGFALELRLGNVARSTKDADFDWRLPEEAAIELLLDAAALHLGDRFTFALERTDEEPDLPGGGQRWRVTATLAGRIFERAVIDIAFSAAPVHTPARSPRRTCSGSQASTASRSRPSESSSTSPKSSTHIRGVLRQTTQHARQGPRRRRRHRQHVGDRRREARRGDHRDLRAPRRAARTSKPATSARGLGSAMAATRPRCPRDARCRRRLSPRGRALRSSLVPRGGRWRVAAGHGLGALTPALNIVRSLVAASLLRGVGWTAWSARHHIGVGSPPTQALRAEITSADAETSALDRWTRQGRVEGVGDVGAGPILVAR